MTQLWFCRLNKSWSRIISFAVAKCCETSTWCFGSWWLKGCVLFSYWFIHTSTCFLCNSLLIKPKMEHESSPDDQGWKDYNTSHQLRTQFWTRCYIHPGHCGLCVNLCRYTFQQTPTTCEDFANFGAQMQTRNEQISSAQLRRQHWHQHVWPSWPD